MNVSLRKLEILENVARSGSVTRTAETLRLTQSAVSMALADLERQAGGQLFKRVGRRLVLNERGRMLLPDAQAIVSGMRRVENLLNGDMDGLCGELRIGASTTVANYLLPSLMAAFADENKNARLSMAVGNTAQMADELAEGKLDLALVEGPVHRKSLDSKFWRRDELVVVVGKHHPWLDAKKITKAMLAEAPWIMRERGSGTREVFEIAMRESVGAHRSIMELGHTEAIKKAVEAGMGVGCLSRLAVQRELDNGWLFEVRSCLKLKRDLSLLTDPNASASQLVEAFSKFLTRRKIAKS